MLVTNLLPSMTWLLLVFRGCWSVYTSSRHCQTVQRFRFQASEKQWSVADLWPMLFPESTARVDLKECRSARVDHRKNQKKYFLQQRDKHIAAFYSQLFPNRAEFRQQCGLHELEFWNRLNSCVCAQVPTALPVRSNVKVHDGVLLEHTMHTSVLLASLAWSVSPGRYTESIEASAHSMRLLLTAALPDDLELQICRISDDSWAASTWAHGILRVGDLWGEGPLIDGIRDVWNQWLATGAAC